MAKPNTEGKVKQLRESLASKVRMARADKRLSQAEVAERAGTSPVRIWEIENGNADPRLSTIVRVAGALGLQVMIGDAA